MPLYGAVEAGGTKFMVAVGEEAGAEPNAVRRIETSSDAAATLREVITFFLDHGPVAAVGVATFGPVDFRKGTISTTPKEGWAHFPLRDILQRELRVPVGFDTDVNGAALAEARLGSGRGAQSLVYVTVGTGIGGGAIIAGKPVHGLLHPEMGHLPVRLHPEEPAGFMGVCPYHGNCLEGSASGPAIEARWGKPAVQLPPGHPAWMIEAGYLAQACLSISLILSPERIVLGGGVMDQPHLLGMVRARLAELNRGYIPLPELSAPGLKYPGLTGAFVLAEEALQ
ncbi:MAG: ROK family protein [Bryobacteraceae bacterium]|nr:ROK family protein [Bryobacteraceae bacterium]